MNPGSLDPQEATLTPRPWVLWLQLNWIMTFQKPKKPSQFLDDGLSLGGSLSGTETSSKAPYEDEDKDFVPDTDDRLGASTNNQNNGQRFT